MTVSQDGSRAVAFHEGNCHPQYPTQVCVNRIDLLSGQATYITGHCGPCLSPSGSLFGQTHGDHLNIFIFDADLIPQYVQGANHEATLTDIVPVEGNITDPRWSNASDDWMVGKAWSGGTVVNSWVINTVNDQSYKIDIQSSDPSDFWPGPLPAYTAQVPAIGLSTNALAFAADQGSNPLPRNVDMVNLGSGMLAAVTVSSPIPWLSVTKSGPGNEQTLTNTVDLSGLEDGTYSGDVRVYGGGAANQAQYTVVLVVGSVLPAPTGVTAAAVSGGQVILAWQDNAADETGHRVEREETAGEFVEVAALGADVTTFTDKSLVGGGRTYKYRVRAVRGGEYSAYSATIEVFVPAYARIAVTAPQAGALWVPGTTQRIAWTGHDVYNVGIKLSLDNGETWVSLLTGARGSIRATDTDWGDYSFTVPEVAASDSCVVEVYDYMEPSLRDVTGVFVISRDSQSVKSPAHAQRPGTGRQLKSVAGSGPARIPASTLGLDGRRQLDTRAWGCRIILERSKEEGNLSK